MTNAERALLLAIAPAVAATLSTHQAEEISLLMEDVTSEAAEPPLFFRDVALDSWYVPSRTDAAWQEQIRRNNGQSKPDQTPEKSE
jgi:hypothetical protein